jgi:hypothetical protein
MKDKTYAHLPPTLEAERRKQQIETRDRMIRHLQYVIVFLVAVIIVQTFFLIR